MVKRRGNSRNPDPSENLESPQGAGSKRGRDRAASSVASKTAELSGDDRFSLSKFDVGDTLKNRMKVAAPETASQLKGFDEEKDEPKYDADVVADSDEDAVDADVDDDGGSDDGDDDGNWKHDDEQNIGYSAELPCDGTSKKAKKTPKNLKPMSPQELATFMKVWHNTSS